WPVRALAVQQGRIELLKAGTPSARAPRVYARTPDKRQGRLIQRDDTRSRDFARAHRGAARDSPQTNSLSPRSPSRDGRSFERPMRGEGRSVALHALDVPVEHREILVGHAFALGDALLAGLV